MSSISRWWQGSLKLALLGYLLAYAQDASAQDQYCATRNYPQQVTMCFDSQKAAEDYLRGEPDPVNGSKYLVPSLKPTQFTPANFYTPYIVKTRSFDNVVGEYYQAFTTGGWGQKRADCNTPVPVPGTATKGCPSEDAAKADFFTKYSTSFPSPPWSGYFSGAYAPDPAPSWGAIAKDPATQRGHVFVTRNVLPVAQQRKFILVNGTEYIHGVDRTDWYRCSVTFHGIEHPLGYPLTDPWPLVCGNNTTGAIKRRQSRQYSPTCGGTRFNPCVPATGNKEYRESDFEWEGQSFTRAYNSIRDLPLQAGFDDNWAHTFSDRLLLASFASTDMYWFRSDGYFEAFEKLTDKPYRSRNKTGVMLFRESDAVALTHGRWRISAGDSQTRWFDDAGLLRRIESGSRTFVLAYCSDADFSTQLCNARGALVQVTSNTGRTLQFEHEPIGIPAGPAGEAFLETRLARIKADGAVLVEYSYDAIGRLTQSSTGQSFNRSYLYGESDRVCRDHLGAAIAGCSAANFPFHLTGVIDEAAVRFATYSYDQKGRVTTSRHAGDAGIGTLAYNANGTVGVTHPSGALETFTYTSDAFRKPSAITIQASGSATTTATSTYTNMRETTRVAKDGTRTNFTYDDFHEVSRKEGLTSAGANTAFTRTIQTDWHTTVGLPTERRTLDAANALVGLQRWAYNARSQVTASCEIDPAVSGSQAYVCGSSANAPIGVRQSTTTYCEAADLAQPGSSCPLLGLVKSTDGPRVDVADASTFEYFAADHSACATAPATCEYRKGDLRKVTNALGHATEYLKYDGAGRALSIKDANDAITDLIYHARGWLTHRKLRGTNDASETDDRITQLEYEPTGLVKRVVQPDGSFTQYSYDAAHRLTEVADNLGNKVVYTLDNAGNRLREDTKDPSGNLKRTLSRVYNQLGQLKTLADAQNNPTDFTYDASGNPNTTTDALARVTDQDHDPLDRLAKTIQDVGGIAATTRYEYDARDNLRKVIDPKNLTTEYVYDGLGNLKELRSPDTGTTLYSYDEVGNRKSQTDARAVTATHGYDSLNRLTSITYPTASDNVSFGYDTIEPGCDPTSEAFAKGRLTRFADRSGSTTFCFDRFGNLTRKAQVTAGQSLVTAYQHDFAGRVIEISTPSSTLIKYTRDTAGRITQVKTRLSGESSDTTIISNVTYYPFGPVNEITYGNGRKLARTYDQDYEIDRILSEHTGGLDLDFTTNAVDNITGLTSGTDGNVFEYDKLDRLTKVREPDQNLLQAFAYDATGNRTSKQVGATTAAYTYAAGDHRLATDGSNSRTYSAVGSTLTTGTRTYVYNDAGRMIETKTGGVRQRQYQYNARGERVRSYKDGTTPQTLTLFDESGHVLGEYKENAARVREYVWMDELPVAAITGATTPTIAYLEPDHLGTPRAAIDPARNVAIYKWPLLDDAFGEGAPQTNPDGDGTQFDLGLRFPGQIADADTGLNYNYFRDYEPGTGRYIESDPIGLRGGLSTFGYVGGKPLSDIDPTGQLVWLLPICAAGGCEAAAAAGAYCLSALAGATTGIVVAGAIAEATSRQCGNSASEAANDADFGDGDGCEPPDCRAWRMRLNAVWHSLQRLGSLDPSSVVLRWAVFWIRVRAFEKECGVWTPPGTIDEIYQK